MGNLCPPLTASGGSGPNERSGLLANQGSSSRPPAPPPQPRAAGVPYTAVSVANHRVEDGYELHFARTGLQNLDKRLSDIASLYASLLERFSKLKTGITQLEQLGGQLMPSEADGEGEDAGGDCICRGFRHLCQLLRRAAADPEAAAVSLQLKQHGKDWTEVVFDSKVLQFEEISFLNLFNLLSRYAWELRSKSPPLRNTVAMTTQEEDSFRRDLLVASLGSASDVLGANFGRLRRLDERLAAFVTCGEQAGARLSDASRLLLDA